MERREEAGAGRDWVTRCAWCGRVLTNGAWDDRQPAESEVTTHGMCPVCFARSLGDRPAE